MAERAQPHAPQRRDGRLFRAGAMLLVLAVVVAFAPLAIAFGASALGEAHGCTVHEGFATPCVIGGRDVGGLLNGAFVLGWLALVTLPLGALLGIAALIVLIAGLVRLRRGPA